MISRCRICGKFARWKFGPDLDECKACEAELDDIVSAHQEEMLESDEWDEWDDPTMQPNNERSLWTLTPPRCARHGGTIHDSTKG